MVLLYQYSTRQTDSSTLVYIITFSYGFQIGSPRWYRTQFFLGSISTWSTEGKYVCNICVFDCVFVFLIVCLSVVRVAGEGAGGGSGGRSGGGGREGEGGEKGGGERRKNRKY